VRTVTAGGFASTAALPGFEATPCAICSRYQRFGWAHIATQAFVCSECVPGPDGDTALRLRGLLERAQADEKDVIW
jgi:hypothetical protein